jgi:hypothetical protein
MIILNRTGLQAFSQPKIRFFRKAAFLKHDKSRCFAMLSIMSETEQKKWEA